ncbi:hypothetical protein [Desulfovibrio sp. UCD-KL4C]|uniref:hypothetical protein n=1 Tax=Desulfovibrio sp. UCD-KL4C TaxID=2578120 RepID=UPI0025C4B0F1|nr:hypothetical protein [Desulfovibrio sp. UCD-KL4C]
MKFFKFKTYFFFFVLLILSFGVALAVIQEIYSYALIGGIFITGFVYVVRFNYTLDSVTESGIIAQFAFFKKEILFKEIKNVKFLNIGEINSFKDMDQFSIKTVKNKYFEVFYLVSSGDFEKIQEKVAQAQLHTGSSNVPK